SSFLTISSPSRRTWRTATLAASLYLCATFTSSLRRSSLSSGIRRRSTWPSVAGERPRVESTIAFSPAVHIALSPARPARRGTRGRVRGAGRRGRGRSCGPVSLDLHRLQHGGRRAAGPQTAQLMLERVG